MELSKIKVLIDKRAKEFNTTNQSIWDMFFFEQFLKRLSASKYKALFIFKGGFLLQNIVGLLQRTTMNIDLKLFNDNKTDNEIIQIFKDIASIDLKDDITYDFLSIRDIKAGSEYGGKNIKISAKFHNIKKTFGIDLGIGDIVTPHPIDYNYTSSLTKEKFALLAYPIETIISEKFQTLIAKGINNSRSKDIFDLYLLNRMQIDNDKLNASMVNTFYYRKTIYEKEYILSTLGEIFSFERTKLLFDNYVKTHKFVGNVTFDNCKEAIYHIASLLIFEEKIDLSNYGVELHLVRHGEDEQNKTGGWSDNHLTENGKKEVNDLLDNIIDSYDSFISSDLNRAIETAKIINQKTQMNVELSRDFREMNNGDLANLTKNEFINRFPGMFFSNLKMDECYPNGESPLRFYLRVKEALIKLLDQNKNKKILIVTHGGVIIIILSLIYGFHYSNLLKISPKTGSLIKLK